MRANAPHFSNSYSDPPSPFLKSCICPLSENENENRMHYSIVLEDMVLKGHGYLFEVRDTYPAIGVYQFMYSYVWSAVDSLYNT